MALRHLLRIFWCRNKKSTYNVVPPNDVGGLSLPAPLWICHVFPYLDRRSQDNLCAASKDVYFAKRSLKLEQEWPYGTIGVKKMVLAVAFSPEGDELAVVTNDSKAITIFHRSHGVDQRLRGHKGQCSDVSYAPSNEFLVSCSRADGSVRLWRKEAQVNKNEYVNYGILDRRAFGTRYVRVSPNSQDIASYGDDGKIYVSNAKDGKLIASTFWRSRNFLDCFKSVSFSSDRDTTLAHSFNNQVVRLWNYRTQTKIELEDNDVTRMVDYAAYVTSLKFVRMFDGDSSTRQEYLARGCLAEYLAVGCRVAVVKIWDLTDYSCVFTIHLGSSWSSVNELDFNQEGTRVACTGGGSSLRVFSLIPPGGSARYIENHKARIHTLAFSPDGKTLASGSSDRTLRLWSMTKTLDRKL
jgi:WD40 repeat protein